MRRSPVAYPTSRFRSLAQTDNENLQTQSPRNPVRLRWGVERREGGDGNWGGPPRPDGLRVVVGASCPITGLKSGSGRGAGRESEAAIRTARAERTTEPGEGRAAASFMRHA